MAVSEIPILRMLKARMHFHQARQQVLAENVANADTRGFRPRDIAPPAGPARRNAGPLAEPASTVLASASQGPAATDPRHMTLSGGVGGISTPRAQAGFETRPSGNSVSLEDEMLKVAQNQQDFQLAASLYQRGLGLMRTASGRR